jgi:hypothetical protein
MNRPTRTTGNRATKKRKIGNWNTRNIRNRTTQKMMKKNRTMGKSMTMKGAIWNKTRRKKTRSRPALHLIHPHA